MTSKELWKKRIEYAVKNNDSTLDLIVETLVSTQQWLELLVLIKNKNVDIQILRCCLNVDQYNNFTDDEFLTQNEFDLLKGWLENDKSRSNEIN